MKCALPSHSCLSQACLGNASANLCTFTVWEDKWKFVSCFFNTSDNHIQVSHNDTTELTCGNLSWCFFFNLLVKDFILTTFSSCFLWAFPACPPQIMITAPGKCCHHVWRVSTLPMNGNVYAFLLCFLESKACIISCSLGCYLIEFLFYQIIPAFFGVQ